jgi:hypothetical protein
MADSNVPSTGGSKVMHGARALVLLNTADKSKAVGIFTQVSYNFQYDTTPVYILGRFSPAELVYTASEPVTISATGFRVLDEGPFDLGMPVLNELLTAQDMTFSIYDRQTNKEIMTVTGVKFTGFGSNVSARGLQDMTFNFSGLVLKDNNTQNAETIDGVAKLP